MSVFFAQASILFDQCNFCNHTDTASYAKLCIQWIFISCIHCYLVVRFPVLSCFHYKTPSFWCFVWQTAQTHTGNISKTTLAFCTPVSTETKWFPSTSVQQKRSLPSGLREFSRERRIHCTSVRFQICRWVWQFLLGEPHGSFAVWA